MTVSEDHIGLNMALDEAQQEKGTEIKIKSASSKMVFYKVSSDDRSITKPNIERLLTDYGVYTGKLNTNKNVNSSMEGTECKMSDGTVLRFEYKPKTGGMNMTTLNASITELFPCIAWETGCWENLNGDNKKAWKLIKDSTHAGTTYNNGKITSSLKCFVDLKDAKAGISFVEAADQGSFQEKVTNARHIYKWLKSKQKQHAKSNPLVAVYWGYRKKPGKIASNHPGDIFLQWADGTYLGVSLKAGTATSAEPKLNTYVKPMFDFYTDNGYPEARNMYAKIKNLLWPNYLKIPGITQDDFKFWPTGRGGPNLGKKLAEKTHNFEKKDSTTYNQLYDENLGIIKDQIVQLMNASPSTTKKYISQKMAMKGLTPPLIVIKATQETASRDTSTDGLAEALGQNSLNISASLPPSGGKGQGGKQAFNVVLKDGIHLNLDFTARTNKSGAMHKLGQFENLAVKFNKVTKGKG